MTPQVTKKCTKLKKYDFLFSEISQNTYWACTTCQNAKFPFANTNNHEIQCLALKLLFLSLSQTTVSDLNGDHLTLNLSSINSKGRSEYNTVETNDEYFEELSMQPDFNYYQIYDFHKLTMKLDKRNCFSILHTNICSLNANLEKLLLTNLDHAFDIVGVSETWTSGNNSNNSTMNNHTVPGYQNFCGTKGSSLKSDCGLFVKEGLNFKERVDLTVKFINNQNGIKKDQTF